MKKFFIGVLILTNQNQAIYLIRDYRYLKGELISVGKKNYKVKFRAGWCEEEVSYVPKEKCAFPDEEVLFIWETWKGRNGRGGYRLEKTAYPDLRIPASQVTRGGFCVKEPGHLTENCPLEKSENE